MITDQILTMLIAERDKLNAAIAALEGNATPATAKRRGRPPKNTSSAAQAAPAEKPARKKRNFSPAQRKAAAKRMKQYWAEKRKTAKKAA